MLWTEPQCLCYYFRLVVDVSLIASMLEILVFALEILHEESSQIGVEINWSKTELQAVGDTSTTPSKMSVFDHDVEVFVDFFVYLGSCMDVHGGSECDICRWIPCMKSKKRDRNIRRSSISMQSKVGLYNVYIISSVMLIQYTNVTDSVA